MNPNIDTFCNNLQVGEILNVPISGKYTTYTVKAGDTCSKIASLYYTTNPVNNLFCDNLQIGQTLIVPSSPSLVSEIDNVISNLTSTSKNVMPTIRIPITSDYWMNNLISGSSRWNKIPNDTHLEYKQYIIDMVNYLTGKGIVCIIDLHWNFGFDNGTGNYPMIIKDKTGKNICK